MSSRLPRPATILQFALAGLTTVVLVSVGSVFVARRDGTSEAIRDARIVAAVDARAVIEPNLDDGVVTGDAAALGRLDSVVRSRVLSPQLVRVKIWTPQGRIAYSDEGRLVGATFHLGTDELEAIANGTVQADVTDLSAPENRFERQYPKLLEVYTPVRTPGGTALLFEVYERYGAVTANAHHIWSSFLPVLLGGLLVLWLLQLPLAWGLARRLESGQEERERLLRRAINASETERRRIARDLHDGVVQRLAGVSWSLSAVARGIDALGPAGDACEGASASIDQAAEETRRSMRELRAVIVDLSPPTLQHHGLATALADLTAPLAAGGTSTRLDVDASVALTPERETVVFRAAQEAIRNVVAHADARHVDVSLQRAGAAAVLTVADDGAGFSSGHVEARRQEGHVGLTLLEGLVADAGGRLAVDSTPGHGTLVRVEVPAGG
ncbi:MAG: sensor histidine kinase [Acidimicrobiales bacterium]